MNALPSSPACERNRAPILDAIRACFSGVSRVLEIGSGTGQHAAWFAPRLPHLKWVTSDLPANHASILAWQGAAGADNLEGPLAIDVLVQPWPETGAIDAAFSANTAHIMGVGAVVAMFEGLGRLLPVDAPFCLYGPFMEQGRHTGEGNLHFDLQLRAQDPGMGLRDVAWLAQVAAVAGFDLENVEPMPTNNRILTWRRR